MFCAPTEQFVSPQELHLGLSQKYTPRELLFSSQTKAKAIRKYVDKMIGLAKDGSLHARRQVLFHGLLVVVWRFRW
jgi:ribosomal protein L17